MMLMTSRSASDRDLPEGALDVRRDFPVLSAQVHGKPLVFLDSGASAQKPHVVLEAMDSLYRAHYANVHRGAYAFSEQTTARYEAARGTVQRFLNAPSADNIVFTSSTTAGINLLAHSYGRGLLKARQRILLTAMEHHANIVPWQLLAQSHDVALDVVPVLEDGTLDLEAFEALLGPDTGLVALTHVSNVLGTINPVQAMIQRAHEVGARVLLDGSQAVMHMPVDVQALDVDFYVFTGHKIYGPTGIGVLYGKGEVLSQMPPFMGGGEMIRHVSFEGTSFADPPTRFEAGTPPIVEAVGLARALDYVRAIGFERIMAHEKQLTAVALERLQRVPGLRIVGQAPARAGILSLVMEGMHPHDIATILDRQGIATRAGHHCAEPLMTALGLTGTTRVSLAIYNTAAELDALVAGLEKARALLGGVG